MKNIELIRKLLEYNMDAEVDVVVHCKKYDFSISYGGPEGETKEETKKISFYVDELCTEELSNNS